LELVASHAAGLLAVYASAVPDYLLSWKLYATLLICLLLEAIFVVRKRAIFSVGLMQDFIFGATKRWFFVPWLLFYTAIYKSFYETAFPFLRWGIAESWHPALQFVVGFLAADFLLYCTHSLKHRVTWMWHFHTIHHSQRNLNPLSVHRTHVVEDLIENPILYLPLAVLGVGYPSWVGVRAFNWGMSHLVHSNVRLNLGPLRHVFVSPQYHRIHHSIEPQHRDKNFGERLVIWDRMFGTMYPDSDEYPETGVAEPAYPLETSARGFSLFTQLWQQYVYPFRRIFGSRLTESGTAR
jgi:sterol desaturase/sphingolipid hydroxylase (fatty acid hydroxylase superfamily)